MSVLSAQSIRSLCVDTFIIGPGPAAHPHRPLISPFVERGISNGRSYGLSACSYDVRIDKGLILWPAYARFIDWFLRLIFWRNKLPRFYGCTLASTIERFIFPDDVCGHVRDKSSLARRFVSVFNTHFDPGFEGYATIEIVNHSWSPVEFQDGDPLCQFVFQSLDEPTIYPYRGKYFNQERGPQEARYEEVK